ncbi:hypothetical protein SNL152K_10222 [Streptomyces sp. NL15-2K]|nr:hypothetical protein SNL152K_10222 [Streptomyces sp. NL15-2K]
MDSGLGRRVLRHGGYGGSGGRGVTHPDLPRARNGCGARIVRPRLRDPSRASSGVPLSPHSSTDAHFPYVDPDPTPQHNERACMRALSPSSCVHASHRDP